MKERTKLQGNCAHASLNSTDFLMMDSMAQNMSDYDEVKINVYASNGFV